jgi:hypothetical protein
MAAPEFPPFSFLGLIELQLVLELATVIQALDNVGTGVLARPKTGETFSGWSLTHKINPLQFCLATIYEFLFRLISIQVALIREPPK